MTRRDIHLDAMLRHLGAAYYESLHSRARPADVTRALDQVADHMGEQAIGRSADRTPATATQPRDSGSQRHLPEHHGRWPSRVRDIMTTSVVTADRITSYKEIAGLLAEHQISGLPVLTLGRHVAGVVSEADLLAARDKLQDPHPARTVLHITAGHGRHPGLTAGDLMTSPAITIHPDATIAGAARAMNTHHVRRLPVVDPDGKLTGLVSRRDLLSVFLRPDEEIARQISELVNEILPGDPAAIKVVVRDGVVTLTGQPSLAGQKDLLPVAVRLAWDIDGVVDVVNRTSSDSRSG
jgi:CBS domain-containing protein